MNFTKGYPGSRKLRASMIRSRSVEDIRDAMGQEIENL